MKGVLAHRLRTSRPRLILAGDLIRKLTMDANALASRPILAEDLTLELFHCHAAPTRSTVIESEGVQTAMDTQVIEFALEAPTTGPLASSSATCGQMAMSAPVCPLHKCEHIRRTFAALESCAGRAISLGGAKRIVACKSSPFRVAPPINSMALVISVLLKVRVEHHRKLNEFGANVRFQLASMIGWGGWIRTNEWRLQRPLPYRLATPQCESIFDQIRIQKT